MEPLRPAEPISWVLSSSRGRRGHAIIIATTHDGERAYTATAAVRNVGVLLWPTKKNQLHPQHKG